MQTDIKTPGSCSYIVSSKKSTSVTASVVGNFRKPEELDIIIAHVNRLEHFIVTPEGLKIHQEIPIFGRIATLNSFRLPGEVLDSILVLTVKYHLSILSFDDGNIKIRAAGHVADRVGRPAETGIVTCLIALRLYESILKIIQWQDNNDLKAFNIRFEDYSITDVAFLSTDDKPTIAYFFEDHNGKHLKMCEIDLEEKELLPPIWNKKPYTVIAPPLMANFICFGAIDKTGERFLLGDDTGRLFMLLLISTVSKDNTPEIKDLKLEYLGEISIPQCLTYLDNAVAFVGSKYGDSQLIRLSTEPVDSDNNSFVQIIDHFNNLGPVRDMNGSLRVVRSGIGLDMIATENLKNIKSIFTIKQNLNLDKYIVLSLPDLTYLFVLDGEELESTELKEQSTLWAGNINNTSTILQINPDGFCLISDQFAECKKWNAPQRITLCSVNSNTGQIILASGRNLYYFKIEADEIVMNSEFNCENEIACLDISPLVEGTVSKVFAVGFWSSNSVALYTLEPTIQRVVETNLASDVLPRSILIISMENIIYLLVALGNGVVHYFIVDSEKGYLTEQMKVTLGTQPTILKKFSSKGVTNVFACSDRPTVIYSLNQKLAFSNVNLKMVYNVSQLNSDYYKDCLLISDSENLIIGTIDDIQKLHIRTIPLGESVSRIAYQQETNTIGILTSRIEYIVGNNQENQRSQSITTTCNARIVQNSNEKTSTSKSTNLPEEIEQYEIEIYSFCVLDCNTFEPLCVYELQKNEYALSMCSATLGNDATPYYAIGTAFGRILIMQANPANTDIGKLKLIAEKEVKGAIYSITTLGAKLICSINSSVRLFEWTAEKELRLECSHFNFICALYIKTKGDLILCGDLMRSLCLLQYKEVDSSFEEIARDLSVDWMAACEIINSDTFLGAENSFNIFCAQRDFNAETEEEKLRLKQTGMFYLGEMVNVFRHGTIISTQPEVTSQIKYTEPIMFGTSDGGLGLVVQLNEEFFNFLLELQKRIATETHNVLRISHDEYRTFYTEKRVEKCKGFVDGDLIETITFMPKETIEKIIKDLKLPEYMQEDEESKQGLTVNHVLRIVDDLSRIH